LPTVSATFAAFFTASKVSQLKISICSIGTHKKKYQLLINCQEKRWKKLKKILRTHFIDLRNNPIWNILISQYD
jgi:hypothetical protein